MSAEIKGKVGRARRRRKEIKRKGEADTTICFDTGRIKDGKADEHRDAATLPLSGEGLSAGARKEGR